MDEHNVPTGWQERESSIERTFEFETFNDAMRFMATAAPKIDALNHHPEWSNVYNTVQVRLTSHDAGAVTERDISLAQVLDDVAAELFND